jgi:hypothetical protein
MSQITGSDRRSTPTIAWSSGTHASTCRRSA